MAQYRSNEGLTNMDTDDLKGYLYQLNEQLRYMFNNMTPEDNFSNQALKKYLEDGERIADLEFGLNGLNVTVVNFKAETKAKFEVTDQAISMRVEKGKVSSEISVETDKVTIAGNRLIVDSTNFKLDGNGNATFSGNVKGATITGSRIFCRGGEFEADEDAVYIGGFYTFRTSRGSYLGSYDQSVGMGDNDMYNFWTGWDGSLKPSSSNPESVLAHYGCVLTPNDAYAQELYLNDPIFSGSSHYWGVGETIRHIYGELDDIRASIKAGV